jgi:hypothetical protein
MARREYKVNPPTATRTSPRFRQRSLRRRNGRERDETMSRLLASHERRKRPRKGIHCKFVCVRIRQHRQEENHSHEVMPRIANPESSPAPQKAHLAPRFIEFVHRRRCAQSGFPALPDARTPRLPARRREGGSGQMRGFEFKTYRAKN